ncbi:MAG: CopG family transcriptional regulator [Longimicrobiales bacterium]
MSHRLQVLIPEELDGRLRKAAGRSRLSKGEWVRTAIEEKLGREATATRDPIGALSRLNAPTADIEVMLGEIEAGRR